MRWASNGWLGCVIVLVVTACAEHSSAVSDEPGARTPPADAAADADAADARYDLHDAARDDAHGCAIELGAEPDGGGRGAMCTAETFLPFDAQSGFVSLWATRGEYRVLVY